MSATTTTTTAIAHAVPQSDVERHRRIVHKAIARRSFAVLATSSSANRPHVAGVMYAQTPHGFLVSTSGDSVKARNIRQNDRVGVSIPVRKVPVGPPFCVQFQTTAEVLAVDDPLVRELLDAGALKAITGHGELDLPDSVFLRLRPPRRVVTSGLGVPLLSVLRHPLEAGRSIDLDGVPVGR
jgi:hypothetical protein